MNARDTFLATMRFERDIPTLRAEYGYWTTTIRRFVREGMPVQECLPDDLPANGTISGAEMVDVSGNTTVDVNVRAFFHLDPYPSKFPIDMSPQLEEEVFEESTDYKTYRDKFGITMKAYKKGTTPPLELAYPIKNREDFERYKEHFDSDFSKRLPKNWIQLKEQLKSRDFPIRLGGHPFGFFGFPRHLIGTSEVFLMMYDDPMLIKEMNEFFLNFAMRYWAEIICEIEPDCVLIWEDMASKTGSMISKQMFEEFLSPYYVRLIDFFHQFGVTNIFVDSDGFIERLLPLWHDLGVTGVFPFEIQAGNDLLRIREVYPKLQLLGGIDKRIFMADRSHEDIDLELEKVRRLLSLGGYVPHADHHVPDDACWKNFKYYRERLNQIIYESSKG